MRPTHRLLSTALALTLVATACGDDLDDSSGATGRQVDLDRSEITLTAGLATFDSCDSLLTHLRTEGAARVGPYGFNDGGYFGPIEFGFADGDVALDVAESAGSDDSGGAAAPVARNQETSTTIAATTADGEGTEFSGTNNQEKGVDEPDIVKTDGNRILTLTSGVFAYVDANDGDPTRRGSIHVGYDTQDMLVLGDRVLLLGTTWGEGGIDHPVPMPVDDIGADVDVPETTIAESTAAVSDIAPPFGYHGPRVRIIELDISNPDDPTEANQLLIDGNYLSARMVDGKARIAIQSNPDQLPFVYPQNSNGEDRAEETNREIVGETELSDWLPDYTLVSGGNTSSGPLSDCNNVHAPVDFAGFGNLSVVTVDMNAPLGAPNAASVLAAGQTVYASADAMWLATNQWIDWQALTDEERLDRERSYSTQVHGFDITGDEATYLASGSVRGHLLNQFAMSEHEGVLRIASTDGPVWGWGATEQSESFVTTFEVDGNELRQLGQVGNMGKGERIFSVRFVGDVGYVVTFRQTDPFYTVDLSDPANPRVLGELKINGYSGQLHPIGPDRILGIGQDATDEGFTTGAKMTVFDVSDLANPTALDSWTLPNAWTDAEWSHHAFLWWAPENLAVIPIQSWQEGFWGALAFRIDPDTGSITEAGRLSHEPKAGLEKGTTECTVLPLDELESYRDTDSPLGELSYEAEWIFAEGGQVQVCGEGEGGAAGLFCERWWDQLPDDVAGPEGTLEVCWPEGPGSDPIVRTLVTGGDTLWSLSWSRLQANDLSTFEAGNWVELSDSQFRG